MKANLNGAGLKNNCIQFHHGFTIGGQDMVCNYCLDCECIECLDSSRYDNDGECNNCKECFSNKFSSKIHNPAECPCHTYIGDFF